MSDTEPDHETGASTASDPPSPPAPADPSDPRPWHHPAFLAVAIVMALLGVLWRCA